MQSHKQEHRVSFLAALIFGFSAVAIFCIVSGAAVLIYGMSIVDNKADTVFATAEMLVEDLPALQAALPPVLADAIKDERVPTYARQLDLSIQIHEQMPGRYGSGGPVVTVKNQGDQVVSVLAVHLLAVDERGRPVGEWTEYLATPLAIEDEWRGPLMPGATRHVSCLSAPYGMEDIADVEYDISEIRVWSEQAVAAPRPPQVDSGSVTAISPTPPAAPSDM